LTLDVSRQEGAGGVALMAVEGVTYVANSALLPETGWRVTHLTPASEARGQALLVMAVAGLTALLFILGAAVVADRRARIRERIAEQEAAQIELEARVAQRTADLNAANAQLTREIDERRTTEARLRKTQKDLVQAGKLAALGQMSAALSHELNQPLTAIKSYADNAAAFLDRGRTDTAKENVGRIRQMADRMAALSGHLRNFARRPQETVGPVDLRLVIEDAVELMGSRLRAARAEITTDLGDGPVWVAGGRLRLQQVFVNLISNALDAMGDQANPSVAITLDPAPEGRVRVAVQDSGSGLSDDILPTLFDPFVTTKAPGQGLGLGLSISYNIVGDFGGRLSAANRPEGGAVFVVELARAEAPGSEVAAQ
jgi:two-component system C4-dicarboxylate transport sensor histidine kinase DctB